MKNARILGVFMALSCTAFPFALNDCPELTKILVKNVRQDRQMQKLVPEVPQSLVELLERAPVEAEKIPVRILDVEPARKGDREKIIKCFGSTGKLLAVSTLVTAAGALMVYKDRYTADARLASLFGMEAFDQAIGDPEFRRQIIWNALLMSAVGMSACYNSKWGNNGVAGAGALSSVAGQLLAGGRFSLSQIAFDTLWVRFISLYKTKLALYASQTYKTAGLRGALGAELFFQSLSEAIGAVGYPWADRVLDAFLAEDEDSEAAETQTP